MNTESQVDPEYERVRKIATSLGFAEYGNIQNIMMQRREVARIILKDWKNKTLWIHFEYIEEQIKKHLHLK